jgi:hypothetical protein
MTATRRMPRWQLTAPPLLPLAACTAGERRRPRSRRDAVARPDVHQPPAQLQPVAAEALDPRPRVAARALVVWQRHGDDEFRADVAPCYGIH